MKKTTPWSEVRKQLDPEVVRRGDEAFAEEYVAHTLAELRRSRGMKQIEIARILERKQATISKLENSEVSSVMLQTLVAFIEGLGGKLDLRVTFPNGERYALVPEEKVEPSQDEPQIFDPKEAAAAT
ncbi:XRE family transcriptional regulator [Microbulbifer sp.]|uniref:XRE family transcriptional regulator n=1 Tax=Microbulbifer sp. TaxID=1908541 RepID=UPI003F2E5F41